MLRMLTKAQERAMLHLDADGGIDTAMMPIGVRPDTLRQLCAIGLATSITGPFTLTDSGRKWLNDNIGPDDHDGSGTGEGSRARAEMDRQRRRPRTYEATTPDGRKARCTVPENDEGDLFAAIREQLSPEAVAAIAAHLLAAKTNNAQVNRQIAWFTDSLIKMLGTGEYTKLCEGLGL